ncbi:RpoE-regulated lipoprotein [Shimwellia blattae]|uniref:Lipoprotein n=1 Tax=Shimwellia blattae (strain ATCC 29907 / DSM 4481 / JCM 1650 / NBRC 105725 / CDC 9005-74) TaxID=630626 RepID=I2B6P8_SHIBC|nr:RpoE-regulated lipoprotein [Shimwellia blattae]AFJ46202.1 hypothetical protein EBL_c10920 [Shimwellia blattae DSM 4481 = NBRC 105725]GAB81159.1 hypothetical protein YfeY [Shimwellia blattae DSM 4481 = NBRC 105725]VDY63669.1 RpoE-regulated lipoprotein [Shimwellia blattae]VEC21772.1 RpoE-regulated lipoprotein [Shimwellia blattae]
MKSLRLMMLIAPLALSGCSTLSNAHWAPWNWFGSSLTVSEQGVGALTASTPLTQDGIAGAIGSDYHLRSGMKMADGSVVRYFEALKNNQLALVIEGDKGQLSRVVVLDKTIPTESGVTLGTPFHELYSKAFGACEKASGDDEALVACKAPDSQHITYLFGGQWRGPQGLMPSDDTLKNWTLNKIVWRR